MYVVDKLEDMKVRFDVSGELSSSDKRFIESYYERILNKRFSRSNCNNCYKDAFIEMYIYSKKNKIRKMGKFILKRGEVIHMKGHSNVYARQNITDDIAINFLRKYPSSISVFESYPDNWEQLLVSESHVYDEEAIVAEISDKIKQGISKKELKAEYKNIIDDNGKKITQKKLSELFNKAESINI